MKSSDCAKPSHPIPYLNIQSEVKWKLFSRVQHFVTPWTIQSMEFSRPEYWSGKPFSSPGDLPNPGIEPRSPILQAESLAAEPQGNPKNTGVGSLSLLQWIFPTQESNWGLLHCRWILYQLCYQGRPLLEWPSSKSLQVTNIGKDVEARKPVYTVGGNLNWYSHYGKQYGGSSKYKT